MSEFKIEKQPWYNTKWRYILTYIPDDISKYDKLELSTGWSSYKPSTYYIDGDTVNFCHNNMIKTTRVEKKYLKGILNFMNKKMNKYPKEIEYNPNKLTVGQLIKEFGIGYFSIGYGETRTINRAYQREVIAYAKGYYGITLFFRKRGGILCYNIAKLIHRYNSYHENRGHNLTLQDGLKILKEVKQQGLGKVYLPKNIEQEIINTIILENI